MFKIIDINNMEKEDVTSNIAGVEDGTFNIIYGNSNVGKSTFIYQLSFCLKNNINFLDLNRNQKKKQNVIILSSEDSVTKISNKIDELKELYGEGDNFDVARIEIDHYLFGNDNKKADENFLKFKQFIVDNQINIIFIDTLESLLDKNYFEKYFGLTKVNIMLDTICKDTGCTIFGLHHSNSAGSLEGKDLVKKTPRAVLKIIQQKEQDDQYFYNTLIFEKINTNMIDSIREFKKNTKNFEINYKVDTSNFVIVYDNNQKNEEQVLRSFYGKNNNIVKNEENRFDKIYYDRRFLKLGMFKNLRDGEELSKGVRYKYEDPNNHGYLEVNMFEQLTTFDASVYSTLLAMSADYEAGTIIDHETAKVVHGDKYQAEISIDKDDRSGYINSINVTTTVGTICRVMNLLCSKENCNKILESLERMNLTVFVVANKKDNSTIITSGKFLNITVNKLDNKTTSKYIVSVTLNPINAQLLLPETYKHYLIADNISYCLGYPDAERKLGRDAANLYIYLISIMSPNQIIEIFSKSVISKIYKVESIEKMTKEELYTKRQQLDYLLLKINDTIPEHFEIERKNNKSLISYRVFRKK